MPLPKIGLIVSSYLFLNHYFYKPDKSATHAKEDPDDQNISHFESLVDQKQLGHTWKSVIFLSFSALGSIYGDIGTSPIYTLQTVYAGHPNPTQEDVYGVMSLIFYLFTLIVVLKYTLIVIRFGAENDEGGQIALYSKLERCLCYSSASRAKLVKPLALFLCFVGCSLAISDGLLTPCTSVMSAVSGLKVLSPDFHNEVIVTLIIFIFLFSIQRFGAHRISYCFAPIIFAWLVCLCSIGFYNIIVYHPRILIALSPKYALLMVKSGNLHILSSSVIAITGAEAMFLDLGYIGQLPIQIATIGFVYPCLMICYLGQSAFVIANPDKLDNIFYQSIPGAVGSTFYWAMLYLATLSTIIASQSLILGVYSIIHQLIEKDLFPKLKVVHLDRAHKNAIYIPAVNKWLMIGLMLTTLLFTNPAKLAAAYGLGVSFDFVVTSLLMIMVLAVSYHCNFYILIMFGLAFIPIELAIVRASIQKFAHGGWFTVMVNCIFFSFLWLWKHCQDAKTAFEKENSSDINQLLGDCPVRRNRFDERTPLRTDMHKADYNTTRTHYSGIVIFHETDQNNFSVSQLPSAYTQFVRNSRTLPAAVIFTIVNMTCEPVASTRIDIYSRGTTNVYKVVFNFGYMEEVVIDKELIDDLMYTILDLSMELPVLHVQEYTIVKSRTPNIFRRLLIEGIFGTIYNRWQVGQFRLHDNFDPVSLVSQVVQI